MAGTMQGKVAVISGGSTGVGRAVGALLAEIGAQVVLLARRADRLETAAREMAGSVLTIPTDVSSGDSVRAAFAQIEERFGRVDILVNSAACRPHPHHRGHRRRGHPQLHRHQPPGPDPHDPLSGAAAAGGGRW